MASREEGEADGFPLPVFDLFPGLQSVEPRGVWGLASRHEGPAFLIIPAKGALLPDHRIGTVQVFKDLYPAFGNVVPKPRLLALQGPVVDPQGVIIGNYPAVLANGEDSIQIGALDPHKGTVRFSRCLGKLPIQTRQKHLCGIGVGRGRVIDAGWLQFCHQGPCQVPFQRSLRPQAWG